VFQLKKYRLKKIIVLLNISPKDRIRGVTYIKCDLCDEFAVEKIKNRLKGVDYVLHAAGVIPGFSGPGKPEQQDFVKNTAITVSLCKILPKDIKGFVYVSTMDVYGVPLYLPIDEKHSISPLTYYSLGKFASEEFLRIFLSGTKTHFTVLRYSHIYGPGEAKIKVIPVFIDKVLKEEAPVFYGDGADRRDYIYVDDAARAMVLGLNSGFDGVVNIGSGAPRSIKSVFEKINRICKKDIKPVFRPRQKAKYDICCDIKLAKRKIGFSPEVDFIEGLKRHIDYCMAEIKR